LINNLGGTKPAKAGLGMVNDGISPDYRQCPSCRGNFKGRKDKRFCSEKCRHLFNRALQQQEDEPLTKAFQAIRRNRSLLKRLCAGKKAIASRETMEAMGFDSTAFSSLHVNGRNQTYYFCADYGFLPIKRDGKETALIIHREPYATSSDPWKTLPDQR
jgi:predicted nucleic acid-binding Zn ribbon protein